MIILAEFTIDGVRHTPHLSLGKAALIATNTGNDQNYEFGTYRWGAKQSAEVTKAGAEVSAGTDISQDLLRSRDAKLAHFGLQGCALHSKF
jgi:hypothetical protein